MAAKSNIARGLLFGAEFFTEVRKKLRAIGLTEEKMFEIVERKFKTASGFAEEVVKLITDEGVKSDFLAFISGKESLILDSVDGKEILAEAKDVFGYIDPDFKNWGAGEKGPATKATPVQVYEMTKDATFSQMFGSFSSDLNKLCLTQAQIKNFVEKYRHWLQTDGYATFFLFRSNNQFFVADVYVISDDTLRVHVLRFVYSIVWLAGDRPRLVVPQLAV